ncbi:MAG: CAF17-like 4Fe-4S cluster assembly/insertion protein YgfZ [Bacteroidota bacterium]
MNDVAPQVPFDVIDAFPFDLIEMRGNDAVDFLQRMSTNDFSYFTADSVQKTLFITDKGRIIDVAWVFNKNDFLVLAVSKGKAEDIIQWLNRYIIMEDLVLNNVSGKHTVSINFTHHGSAAGYATDYFSFPVRFDFKMNSSPLHSNVPPQYDVWRIDNGIPVSGKEIVQDFNPLELHLWEWISFSKGCYIGQEVIARLDTYNKIQRALYKFSTPLKVEEKEILIDSTGMTIGKITSVIRDGAVFNGLAVIKTKDSSQSCTVQLQNDDQYLILEPVIRKGGYGRD